MPSATSADQHGPQEEHPAAARVQALDEAAERLRRPHARAHEAPQRGPAAAPPASPAAPSLPCSRPRSARSASSRASAAGPALPKRSSASATSDGQGVPPVEQAEELRLGLGEPHEAAAAQVAQDVALGALLDLEALERPARAHARAQRELAREGGRRAGHGQRGEAGAGRHDHACGPAELPSSAATTRSGTSPSWISEPARSSLAPSIGGRRGTSRGSSRRPRACGTPFASAHARVPARDARVAQRDVVLGVPPERQRARERDARAVGRDELERRVARPAIALPQAGQALRPASSWRWQCGQSTSRLRDGRRPGGVDPALQRMQLERRQVDAEDARHARRRCRTAGRRARARRRGS